jgi:hypothetical protein
MQDRDNRRALNQRPAPRKGTTTVPRTTTKIPTLMSERDKLINTIRKEALDSSQLLPSAKLLFGSLLLDLENKPNNSNDSYILAETLFTQEKYMAAISIGEKFTTPKFVLLNAMCHVCLNY